MLIAIQSPFIVGPCPCAVWSRRAMRCVASLAALALVAGGSQLVVAASFLPLAGSLTIRAGDKPMQSAPAVIGSTSLFDNSFPNGFDVASASLQASVANASQFNFVAAASSLTNVDPAGTPRATATVSFQQSFTTATRQWIELVAKVEDHPADAGTAAVVSFGPTGQAPTFSIGHSGDFETARTGVFPAGTYTLSGFMSTQAIDLNPPNHDANIAGYVLVAQIADFNGDGVVAGSDLAFWRRGFGEAGATFATGNLDGDADVDGADFLLWQRQLGTPAIASSAIPEPSAAVLASLAAIVLLLAPAFRSAQLR